jgi:hypothetical protein
MVADLPVSIKKAESDDSIISNFEIIFCIFTLVNALGFVLSLFIFYGMILGYTEPHS